ncbi:MAG: hypothetical protein WC533_01605 [Candidatus Pacearchaeota archaeon]
MKSSAQARKPEKTRVTIGTCYENNRCVFTDSICVYRARGFTIPESIEKCRTARMYRRLRE